MAFGVTDTIVAGRYSQEALAALSVGSAVYISVFVALIGVLQVLLPAWAELHGAGRNEDLGRSVRQSLYLAGLATATGFIGLFASAPLAALDRRPAGDAGRGAGLPRRARAGVARDVAVPPVQHAQPEPGQAAARHLAANGGPGPEGAAVDLVRFRRMGLAGAWRGGMRLGHRRRQLPAAGRRRVAAAHAAAVCALFALAAHGAAGLARHRPLPAPGHPGGPGRDGGGHVVHADGARSSRARARWPRPRTRSCPTARP